MSKLVSKGVSKKLNLVEYSLVSIGRAGALEGGAR